MRTASPTATPGRARAVAVYTGMRGLLLVLCLLLGWVAGLSGVLLLVVALLVSGTLSWFLLRRQRIEMGAAVDGSLHRVRSRVGARAAAEDAYVDRMTGMHEEDRGSGTG